VVYFNDSHISSFIFFPRNSSRGDDGLAITEILVKLKTKICQINFADG